MYVCMYVCMYVFFNQGRIKSGRFGSHQVGSDRNRSLASRSAQPPPYFPYHRDREFELGAGGCEDRLGGGGGGGSIK